MTTDQIGKIRNAAVLAKLNSAKSLGIMATWRAQDHRSMVADVLLAAAAEAPSHAGWMEILKEIDNHSAYAQALEKKFLGHGHFARGEVTGKTLADVMKELST